MECHDQYMCVICCEFFMCDGICQGFARCGHYADAPNSDDDVVCFDCRPLVGWIAEDSVDADGDPIRMVFCSEKCKGMSQEMRKCENDLEYDSELCKTEHHKMALTSTDSIVASGLLMTLDGAQRRKEAHAILQAYECRHLEVKPYGGFPVRTTPDWKEYEPKMTLMTP